MDDFPYTADQRLLQEKFDTDLEGKRVVVFGGTGVVAFASAVIASTGGAKSVLVGYDGPDLGHAMRIRHSSGEWVHLTATGTLTLTLRWPSGPLCNPPFSVRT